MSEDTGSVVKIEMNGENAYCLIYPTGIADGVDGGGEIRLGDRPRTLRLVIERDDGTTTTLNIKLDSEEA